MRSFESTLTVTNKRAPLGTGAPLLPSFRSRAGRARSISLVLLTLFLSLFGLVMIYSASNYAAERNFGDAFYYVKKQAVALFVGGAAMFGTSRLDPYLLKKFRYVILAISFALLGVIFLPGVGMESYGARRWINLGFMTMQPSEVAKFGYVIYAASYLSDHGADTFRKIFATLFPLSCIGIKHTDAEEASPKS